MVKGHKYSIRYKKKVVHCILNNKSQN